MEKIIESNKEQDTYDLGYELGQHAKPGQVFTLVGDLGVGKTVFTKGLAAGLGITEPVSSPTFTIVQVYDEGRLPFYHFDVYRIGDVEEMDEIGLCLRRRGQPDRVGESDRGNIAGTLHRD